MSRVVVTRTISAPARQVWDVFTNLAGRRSWLSDVEFVEELTPGPFGVGTRWRETRLGARRQPITEELEVTALDPGRSCTITLAGAGAHYQLTYAFTPIDVGSHRGATTVAAVYEGRPHGLTNRFLMFFLGGFDARTVEGALRDDLDALAKSVDARAVPNSARSARSARAWPRAS